MSDDKKNEQGKPIQDETLDKVSGGVIIEKGPVSPIPHGGGGPPPIKPPTTPIPHAEPL